MAFQHALSTNNYGMKIIVATLAANGTHTTLSSALADASVGDTVYLRDSVTENVTLPAGINVASWYGSSASSPSITGKITMTAAGTSSISGIELITNSDFAIAVTGSAASILNVNNCYLNCSNNTGITFSSSSGSSRILINYCKGNLATTGITLFALSGAGNLQLNYCYIENSGASTTASTISSGSVNLQWTNLAFPVTTSSTGGISIFESVVDSSPTNTTAITAGGSGAQFLQLSQFSSGTASTISISSSAQVYNSNIASSNTNAITGAGSLLYSNLAFLSTSSTINVTTQTIAGTIQGSKTTAPTVGFLGEQIRAYATGVALTSTVAANITSISLTAGVWDISIVSGATFSIGGLAYIAGISPTSATLVGNLYDQQTQINVTNVGVISVSIPAWRVVLTATTTYFLVGNATFASGTGSGAGRISATRVG